MEVDSTGFVTNYPGLWQAEPAQRACARDRKGSERSPALFDAVFSNTHSYWWTAVSVPIARGPGPEGGQRLTLDRGLSLLAC